MTTFKLMSKSCGISKEKGTKWFKIYLRGNADGDFNVKEFFVNENVWNDMIASGVAIDDDVLITCALDQKLRFVIDVVEKAN